MNKKLYVGNLPFSADDAALKAHFGSDGRQVTSARVMMDRETGRSRGFAFVEMASPEDAQKAIAALNGKDFMGRPLMINEAREQAPRPGGGFGGPRPAGGFNRPDRPNGGFGGGGGNSGGGYRGPSPGGFGSSYPPAAGSGFEPPPEDRGGRANRDRGKDRDKRRRNGNNDDWS